MKKIEYSETQYRKAEIADDIVKLSLFMLVNQAYFKTKGKSNCCKRAFVLYLEALALVVEAV